MSRGSETARALPGVLLFALLGLGAICMSISDASENARFRSTAERTVGTVTRWETQTVTTKTKDRQGRTEEKTWIITHPVAAFTYQGVTYEVRRSEETTDILIGTEVPIVFQPSAPHQADFDDGSMDTHVTQLLIFGLVLLAFSGCLFLSSDAFSWHSLRSLSLRAGAGLLRSRMKRRKRAPRLYLREHVRGQKLVLETGAPHRAWLLAVTAGCGLSAAAVAFDRGAPLAGLGLFVGAGALLVLLNAWMTYRVTFTLAAVEQQRGFRRKRLERSGLRGVRLEPEAPEPEDPFRLWLEPRAPVAGPIEALNGSFGGTILEARARLGTLREALESLDLRLSGVPEAPAVDSGPLASAGAGRRGGT
ncbi:MAG TPA: DUF3592 domain-containing protein [Myxococcus sp.]|nr:DUF3592 domain-containing protein [Myxococcus sp.]